MNIKMLAWHITYVSDMGVFGNQNMKSSFVKFIPFYPFFQQGKRKRKSCYLKWMYCCFSYSRWVCLHDVFLYQVISWMWHLKFPPFVIKISWYIFFLDVFQIVKNEMLLGLVSFESFHYDVSIFSCTQSFSYMGTSHAAGSAGNWKRCQYFRLPERGDSLIFTWLAVWMEFKGPVLNCIAIGWWGCTVVCFKL